MKLSLQNDLKTTEPIKIDKNKKPWERWILKASLLVGLTGLEPVTPTMSTWYSNQLSYNPEAENDISMKQGDLQADFEHFIVWPDQTVTIHPCLSREG